MRALLLAGGKGTRLKPLTDALPKCMMPIHGRPLLDIWLEELIKTKIISKILVNVSYKKEIVINYLLNSSWKEYVEIADEKELLGTAGTIFKNYDFFQGKSFFVAHADNLCITNLNSFIEKHNTRINNTELTMMLFKTKTPETCGVVKLNQENVVEAFFEKEKGQNGNLANGAVFIFDNQLKKTIDNQLDISRTPLDISQDIIPLFVGKINTFLNNGIHIDIGNIASWNEANSIEFDSNFSIHNANLWNKILQQI
ncbi:nucleotidyltransferase family protein [Gammaproteobacteria bacterium]|nr:nucleotidyltransferase family protein [Gammaproteobacteria bacterium]